MVPLWSLTRGIHESHAPASSATEHRCLTGARRRIHAAAAKRDQSVRDYVREAVETRLRHDLAEELSGADLVVLNGCADPVLAGLWNNSRDAEYEHALIGVLR